MYITSIIMILITILLMIEADVTSFAKNACHVHIYIYIYFIIGDENGCKTNSVFYFNVF